MKERLRKALGEALDTIQWMSGSGDFAPGGKAHKGWLKAKPVYERGRAILDGKDTRELLLGAVARGWCHSKNETKQMDPDLAEAIVEELLAVGIEGGAAVAAGEGAQSA